MSKNILVDRVELDGTDGYLGLVTMNRPDQRNPLDWTTLSELRVVLGDLGAEKSVRVVAITGAGSAFSAGGDMESYRTLQRDPVRFPAFLEEFHRLVAEIAQQPKPYIALVNGVAVAGGLELILACDLAIAAESARIGDAHQPFGQMGGGGVLSLLAPAVGIARAKELLFTGKLLSSKEAEAIGLVVDVVPDDDLIEAGLRFANAVGRHSPLAIANAKQVVSENHWADASLASALHLERERTARYCLTSEDAPLGLEAFASKVRPAFTGR